MSRALPKIIVLAALATIVGAIYYVTWGEPTTARHDPGIVYVNPGIGTR